LIIFEVPYIKLREEPETTSAMIMKNLSVFSPAQKDSNQREILENSKESLSIRRQESDNEVLDLTSNLVVRYCTQLPDKTSIR
jgi:hypothetical protein